MGLRGEGTGEKMNRRNKRRKRIVRLAFAALVVAAVLIIVFLFRIRDIDIYGNTRHASGEIASGLSYDVLTKNTLYFLWKYKDGEIPDSMPYLNTLHVQMKSPFHVEVQVTEKDLVAYIDKGEYVYFDKDGIILEISDEIYDGIPIVTGASTEEPVLYQKLPTQSSAQLRTILSLTQLLAYHSLQAKEIRFGENMEMTVFIDNVEVRLGQDEYLEEKIANLNKIMPNLAGKTGTLHLESFTGRSETVSFSPSDEPNASVDVNSGGSQDGTDGSGGVPQDGGDGAADGADGNNADGGNDEGNMDGGSDSNAADGASDSGSDDAQDDQGSVTIAMVFDSSGSLVYNVHVSNGTVVDAAGNPVPGVTIDGDGYIVDAYMNRFDPTTGELVQ